MQRFIQQAATEEMALSGCNFFRVTRAFILTVRTPVVPKSCLSRARSDSHPGC